MLQVVQHPALVDEALGGSIEPEHQEESFVGIRGHPVLFHTLGRLGAKINIHRSISIGCRLFTTAYRLVLVGPWIQQAAGSGIVSRYRPEIFNWRFGSNT